MQNTPHQIPKQAPLAVMPWSLRAWPPLLWQAGDDGLADFRHVNTCIAAAVGSSQRLTGQTVWAGRVGGAEAGMAWDWVEITSGIVAMADPLAVVTNLRVVGDEGEVLTALEAARYLNGLVRNLPWQHEVGRALATRH